MIRVVLADDHMVFVQGLVALLEKEIDIEIAGLAYNGYQALSLLRASQVDVLVLDIELPLMRGDEVARQARAEFQDIAILILSFHKEFETISRIKEAGINGYVLKEQSKEEVVAAIRNLAHGKEYYSTEVMRIVMENLGKVRQQSAPELTEREQQVLAQIGDGKSSREIADALCIAMSTVETHRRNLLSKLNCRNSKELVRYAAKHGYVNPTGS